MRFKPFITAIVRKIREVPIARLVEKQIEKGFSILRRNLPDILQKAISGLMNVVERAIKRIRKCIEMISQFCRGPLFDAFKGFLHRMGREFSHLLEFIKNTGRFIAELARAMEDLERGELPVIHEFDREALTAQEESLGYRIIEEDASGVGSFAFGSQDGNYVIVGGKESYYGDMTQGGSSSSLGRVSSTGIIDPAKRYELLAGLEPLDSMGAYSPGENTISMPSYADNYLSEPMRTSLLAVESEKFEPVHTASTGIKINSDYINTHTAGTLVPGENGVHTMQASTKAASLPGNSSLGTAALNAGALKTSSAYPAKAELKGYTMGNSADAAKSSLARGVPGSAKILNDSLGAKNKASIASVGNTGMNTAHNSGKGMSVGSSSSQAGMGRGLFGGVPVGMTGGARKNTAEGQGRIYKTKEEREKNLRDLLGEPEVIISGPIRAQ